MENCWMNRLIKDSSEESCNGGIQNFLIDTEQNNVDFRFTFRASPDTTENAEPVGDAFNLFPNKILGIADFVDKRNFEYPYCVICDIQMPKEVAESHIGELSHLQAFLRHHCENIVNIGGTKYYCKRCDRKFPNISRMYLHLNCKKHMKFVPVAHTMRKYKNLSLKIDGTEKQTRTLKRSKNIFNSASPSCIFVKMSTPKKFDCQICIKNGKSYLSQADVNSHITGNRHCAALKKHGCNSIVPNDKKNYHCKLCDCQITSRNKLWLHVKEEKHLFLLKIFRCENNDFEREETATNIRRANLELATRIENYRAMKEEPERSCDEEMSNHTEEDNRDAGSTNEGTLHRENLKHSECSTNRTGRLFEQKIAEIDRKDLKISENLRYIAKRGSKTFFCQICDDIEFYVEQSNLTAHITGIRHVASLKKYGCDNVVSNDKNIYHCELCDCKIIDREILWLHVKDEKHLSLLKISRREDNDFVPEEIATNIRRANFELPTRIENYYSAKKEEPARSIDDEKSNHSKDDNRNAASTSDEISRRFHDYRRRDISIAESNDNIFYFCLICDNVRFRVGGKRLRKHVNGLNHKAAVAKYGCDNIVAKGNNAYRCECCNKELLTLAKARRHVITEEHLCSLRNENSNIQDVPEGSVTLQQTNVSESVIETASCIYIINYGTDKYSCQICCDEKKVFVRRRSLGKHIASQRHRDALKRYNCDDIVLDENENYCCICCNYLIGNINKVFLHIKLETHLNTSNRKNVVSVPYRKHMISNFVLEEQANDTPIETNRENSDSAEQFEENNTACAHSRFNEFADRNLALHYISSDPDVLCNGTVAKGTRGMAKRIVKQYNDDPYCLICNFEIPGYRAVDDHVKGKFHANSLLRYGCDNIVQKNSKKFYCKSCNYYIAGIEAVYRHVRTKVHLMHVCRENVNDRQEETNETRIVGMVEETAKVSQRTDNVSDTAIRTYFTCQTSQRNNDFYSCDSTAGKAEIQKPPEFGKIVSSLSADLSRMLAHLEEVKETKDVKKISREEAKNPRPNQNKKRLKQKRMVFGETSSDRKNGYECTVCEIRFARMAQLHSHMSSHFSEEFGFFVNDADESKNDIDEDNFTMDSDGKRRFVR